MDKITITPEYWTVNPTDIKYTYVSKDPPHYLVNVGSVSGNYVHLWSVNAHGQFIREAVNAYEFKAKYQEHKS